jgi:hypothetical protein
MKPQTQIKTFITYTLGQGVIVSADIPSKSRANITHYTRLVIDPVDFKITKATCDCEGYTFKGKCWHIDTLKGLAFTELKEQIEEMAKEGLKREEDTLWG